MVFQCYCSYLGLLVIGGNNIKYLNKGGEKILLLLEPGTGPPVFKPLTSSSEMNTNGLLFMLAYELWCVQATICWNVPLQIYLLTDVSFLCTDNMLGPLHIHQYHFCTSHIL